MPIGFELQSDGTLTVNLPQMLRSFVSDAADIVAQNVSDSSAPGYARVCSPVDPSLDDDDPLARLERQMTIESLCDDVRANAAATVLSAEQAESWIRVLTMSSAILAHVAGIFTDEQRDKAAPDIAGFLDLSNTLQCAIVYALDPEIQTHTAPESDED